MSTEANKAILRRLYAELAKRNFDVIDEVFDPGYISHNFDAPEGEQPGIEGAKRAFRAFASAFPDMQIVDEDMIAEGDKVVHRLRYRATHTGPFLGMQPTGKQVNVSGVDIYRFENGKIVEKWTERDRLSMIQQLGGMSKV